MNETELKQQIETALVEWEAKFDTAWEPAGKAFQTKSVRDAINQLLALAKSIRDNYCLVNALPVFWQRNQIDNNLRGLVEIGQGITGYLFSWGLRNEVTDKIEQFYGINFSGLGIHPEAINNQTQALVFIAYYDKSHSSVTYFSEGAFKFMPREEFDKQYTKVKRP